MKIQIASDLHLEFFDDASKYSGCIEPMLDRDVLVLAGDVHLGNKASVFLFDQLKISDVIYILGNHEYYNHVFSDVFQEWNDGSLVDEINYKASEKGYPGTLYFLENDEVILGGVRFLGCTLWSSFQNGNLDVMNAAKWDMNDYHIIYEMKLASLYSYSDKIPIKPEFTLDLHESSVKYLKKRLKEEDIPTVVVTHHAPSYQSIPAKFKNSSVNGAYATDLEYLICKHKPKLYIHGHTHDSFDYVIDTTRVICNPFGYYGREENPKYKKNLMVEI